ncbi:hypothetical protein A9G09_05735 [Gilliamella sp. wkB292]|nr:hypothetical protein A9G09_05735 [Gilliamella apicola]
MLNEMMSSILISMQPKRNNVLLLYQVLQFKLGIVGYAVVMEFNKNEHIPFHFHLLFKSTNKGTRYVR